ncbi:phosphotransferase family protein [Paenibacillus arenilitoris]|uniref:Uncharacterized protein n=1 Tax=Paenibacillus arenilitoris TaxID=2772299 RepID=A0A927CKI1_9BACL|nr:hypothetical protein [Paenibacillus arenilitoris]MBD2869130.1 hypothetical protein [Paenibacillus arenilitoris]
MFVNSEINLPSEEVLEHFGAQVLMTLGGRINTIVDQTGQVILLDWGNAAVSTVNGDIINVLQCHILDGDPDSEHFKAFLDGYGIHEDDLADRRHLLLLRAFDNLRWAIDRSPDQIESYAAIAKQVVDMTMD